MKIPYDFSLYNLSFRISVKGTDLSDMGHGPQRNLKPWEIKTLRCGLDGRHDTHSRLWVYTYFGAFFFDWRWI